MKFCTKCGAELNENSKFCVACGNPVVAETLKPAAKEKHSVAQVAAEQTAKKQKKWKLAVILILASVLLIGCGGAVIADLIEDGKVNLFGLLDSGSVNNEDDPEKNNSDDKGDVELALNLYGLEIMLPKGYEQSKINKYRGSITVQFSGDEYIVHVTCSPLENEKEGMSAQEYRDYVTARMDLDSESSQIDEWDKGKNNGTYYMYAIKDDKATAMVYAFYVDGNSGWQVKIVTQESFKDYNVDEMIDLITGWECNPPESSNPPEDDTAKEKGTIAVIAPGEYHAFWQAVKAGACDAAAAYGYTVTFQGPTSESPSEVPNQRDMVQAALSKEDTQAIVLATIGTGFVDELIEAYEREIPVVEFASGIWADDIAALEVAGKDPTIGSVATDNKLLGALAADRLFDYLLESRVIMNGYKVGIIQHDETQTGVDRAEGFIEKINELAKADNITLDINLQVKANNPGEYKLGLTALKDWGAQAIFMTNEGVVNEVYFAITDDVDTYKHILFCGVDAGTCQYNWIKDAGENYALLVGSVAQDSYSIGYHAVEMAIAELEGREENSVVITSIGIAGVWYNTENIDALTEKNIIYMG